MVRRGEHRPHRRAARKSPAISPARRPVPGAQAVPLLDRARGCRTRGRVETRVVQLSGKDPTIRLRSRPWGPNVYVSPCSRCAGGCTKCRGTASSPGAGRRRANGRQRSGTRARSTRRRRRWSICQAGIRLRVRRDQGGQAAHKLDVKVTRDAKSYAVRAKAQIKVRVVLPDGKPAPAGTKMALAAVDEALLELMPNDSWDVLDAMLQRRAYGVETSTAQMEIIGRAAFRPQGGAGGRRRRKQRDARTVRHAAACGTRASCSTRTARHPSTCR